jgi:rod shape determining protein RodA
MDRGGRTLNLKRLKFIDKPFLISLVLIIGFGLVVLSSASQGISGDPYFYVKKQVLFLGVGLIAALLVLRYDYSHLRRYGIILYGLSVFLLIAVLVVGEEVRGTTGWISLGPLPAVQPAEFTKIMLAISFADFLNKRKGMLNTLGEILPCIVYMGVPFVLILMQPDLGTALVYIAMTVVMMFVAGANPRILGGLIALGAGFIGLMLFMHFQYGMWLPLEDYQIKRLTVFLNPYEDGKGGRGAGWNTIQSLIAIGSGGLTGLGLFNGTQVQLNFFAGASY